MKRALQVILAIAVIGVAFSGFLSFREIFAAEPVASCPAVGQPGTVLGYPACVYGLFMYLAVAVVATLGLRKAATTSGRSASGLAAAKT
ncbi:MAG TPA: hypothetical protein VGF45_12190 [Polyangia bacterium]